MFKKAFFLFTLFIFSSIYLSAHTTQFINAKQIKKVEKIYGLEGKKRLIQFNNMLQNTQDKNIATKLKIVNDFFNSLTYKKDTIHWKVKDYWASPFEFIGSGAGDCEDFAIAKYYALRLLGIDHTKLKISYAFLKNVQSSHAVLSYYHDSKHAPIVLDNINKKLKSITHRKDIKLYRKINITKVIALQNLLWS